MVGISFDPSAALFSGHRCTSFLTYVGNHTITIFDICQQIMTGRYKSTGHIFVDLSQQGIELLTGGMIRGGGTHDDHQEDHCDDCQLNRGGHHR